MESAYKCQNCNTYMQEYNIVDDKCPSCKGFQTTICVEPQNSKPRIVINIDQLTFHVFDYDDENVELYFLAEDSEGNEILITEPMRIFFLDFCPDLYRDFENQYQELVDENHIELLLKEQK